jgi:hypothetical protein
MTPGNSFAIGLLLKPALQRGAADRSGACLRYGESRHPHVDGRPKFCGRVALFVGEGEDHSLATTLHAGRRAREGTPLGAAI